MKKIGTLFAAALVACSSICSAYEYDVKTMLKETKTKQGDAWKVVADDITQAMTASNKIYENDDAIIEVSLAYHVSMENYSGHLKEIPAEIISGNHGWGLGKMHIEARYGFVTVDITNKTDKVMEVDLDKSAFTLGKYSGRLVRGEVRKMDSGSVVQAPLIIPPKAKISTDLYIPVGVNEAAPRLLLDSPLFSSVVMTVNGSYIAFAPQYSIDSTKLHWKMAGK